MKGTMAAKQTDWNKSFENANPPAGAGPGRPVFRINCPAELTAANGDVFGRQVTAAMQASCSIELNLANTKFLDCAGLGELIALGKIARGRQGVLRVVNPRPSIRQLFEIMDAGRMFDIGDTRPEHPEDSVAPTCPAPSTAPRPEVLWLEPDPPAGDPPGSR